MVAMTYRHLQVRRVAGALGAEITGVDLGALSDAAFVEIQRAFCEYSAVYFPDQRLTPEQQCAFTGRFGPLTHHPLIATLPGHPHVAGLVREADSTGMNFGGSWHADSTFMESPPFATSLYAIEVPPQGGDTLFASLYLAYETLSAGMRELCDRLVVVHSAAAAYDPDRGANDPKKSLIMQKGMQYNLTEDPKKEMEHPLVCVHPVSGRKVLWETGVYCLRFRDMTEEESAPLLNYLRRHIANPNFTCRMGYRPGTLGMWDNRAVQHFAMNDYAGYRRVMHRVQVGGPPPVGPAMPVRTVTTASQTATVPVH